MEIRELEEKLRDFANENGYSLASLSYTRIKGKWTLALTLDRREPIDLMAISEISEKISAYLDELDPIPDDNYLLDISSLGAEKPLKIEDLYLYIDSLVNVHLTNPVNGENIYQGKMVEVNDDSIIMEVKNKSRVKRVVIDKSNIRKIRLAISY